MPVIHRLVARDLNDPAMLKALIALAVITTSLLFSIVGYATFKLIKRRSAARQPSQPDNYRRLTIETMGVHSREKQSLMDSSSPPASPSLVPEIRITFPDEVDRTGRPQSGRVVVVRMGENASVGLEPFHAQLPAYEKIEGSKFDDLDLESIGGLKEK
jgi:hypothetical protein